MARPVTGDAQPAFGTGLIVWVHLVPCLHQAKHPAPILRVDSVEVAA